MKLPTIKIDTYADAVYLTSPDGDVVCVSEPQDIYGVALAMIHSLQERQNFYLLKEIKDKVKSIKI